jgi:hypothetical protein
MYLLQEYVGRGVDLFDVDLWSPPTRERVIGPSAEIAGSVIGGTGLTKIYSDNYLDIKRKIAAEAGLSGSYEGFSGSIDTKYNYSDQTIQKLHFMKISFLVTGNRLSIRDGREGLKRNLTSTFAAAIRDASPDALFNAYGTHIATAIRTGGKAEYFCRSSETTRMTSHEFEAAATAKYSSLGGSVEGKASTTVSSATEQKDVIGNESISTLGGETKHAAEISSTDGWAEWAASCDQQPAFLGFDEHGLVPIWELTDDPTRRAKIRDAYRRHAAKTLRTHIMYETSESSNHPEARITVPDGYKLLSGGALDDYSGAGNLLTASFPESDNTWRANGKNHIDASTAKLSAYAIVTYDPDNIWDVVQRSTTSTQAGWPKGEASVPDGYTMIGGGAQVNWSGEGSLLTSSYPSNRITWTSSSKDHEKSSPATITTYAIGLKCNVGGLNLQQHIQKSSSTPGGHLTANTSSPAGYVMVGGGAFVNFSGAGNLLTASYPRDIRTWQARSKDHVDSCTATLDVYCVSLKVVDSPA